MAYTVHQSCLFLLLYFMGQIISICQGPYQNLCMYDEGDNGTETDDQIICDCQNVTFCFVIELSQDCNFTTLKLNTDANITLFNQLHCEVLPLEAQTKIPTFEFLPQRGQEIPLKIFSASIYGRYKVVCSIFEISDKVNSSISSEWEIVNLSPTTVLIDSEVEFQLIVVEQAEISSLITWCFVSTPDNNIEILLTSWVSNSLVNCSKFHAAISGVVKVSLSSVMTPNIFEKAMKIEVLSKPPVAQRATYSLDFNTLFIQFDGNIELHSTCHNVFSKHLQQYLGAGFNCCIRGNTFIVKMGSQYKFIDYIAFNPENKICRAGSKDAELCLSASLSGLPITKSKISGPHLSWYINSACKDNSTEKYMSVKITHANLAIQNQALQFKTFGKIQRKNLIMWRHLRQFQNKLSSRQIILQTNETNVVPVLENVSFLENILDFGVDSVVSPVKVSVTVQSSSASSFIVAEADVTFCENSEKLFRFKWFVNKKDIFEDTKLVILKNLAPGKYVIKCMVVAYNSTEILGEGWTITELLASEETILIAPSEVTVGIASDIFLQAVSGDDNSVSWTCKTTFDEPCFTTNQKLFSDTFDLNSPNISIPAGTLPIGRYIWTVESTRGFSKAKVSIKPEIVSSINVKIPSVFLKASEEIVLVGTVKKVERSCHVWWSSVRQKGFSYFKLPTIENQKNAFGKKNSTEEVPLVITTRLLNDLEFDSFYMFKFQVFCPQSSKNEKGFLAYMTVPLIIRQPPRVTPLVVEPLEGKAMITNFVISGAHVDVLNENDLLEFEWGYIDPCDVIIPIKRGAFSKNFSTYLPPGDLKVVVKVCREKEICSTASSPTISVIQALEFPAENFRNACSQIQHLMITSNTVEAFGLAVTVFKSLTLLGEPEVRQEIFSTVEESIKFKINDFTRKIALDSKAAKSSLEFFEQAVKVAKYFRKGSKIMDLLTEFKDSISKVLK